MKEIIEIYLKAKDKAKEIIEAVVKEKKEGKFDTHDFIIKMLQDMLNTPAGNDTIIQTMGSQIGRYLSENHVELGIEKTGKRVSSKHSKGTKSTNQEWKKTTPAS
jgi:uncharacterized protein involved in tellurium resistance